MQFIGCCFSILVARQSVPCLVRVVFFYIGYTALVHEQLAKLFVLEKKLADTVFTGLFVVFSGNHLASFMKGTHMNERNVELSIKAVILF